MTKKVKKSNSLISKITSWKVMFAIQLIASILLVGLLFKLSILPTKYFGIVIGILVVLDLIFFFLLKSTHDKGVKSIIIKIISLLLSAALLFGSLYVAKGNSTLDKITGANKQTNRYNLVVLKDSNYKKLSDLSNMTVEMNSSSDEGNYNKVVEALNKEDSSIKTENVGDYEQLANDLYSGSTAAILLNEASYAYMELTHENFENEVTTLWSHDITTEVADISKDVNVTKNTFTVYISGIDTSGPVSTVSRSDVNMLMTVNPKTKQILLTSIPRDYYVTLANMGAKDKLTHSGLAGVENSVKTIENFMGIDINYYARVNFTSLITMVDALGGITVNSPVAFYTNSETYVQAGDNYFNGKEALAFARERYSLAGGDNDRVKNQQRVLTAMLNKAMSPKIITNYSGILDAISGSFETNMSSKEITSFINMQIDDMSSWDIEQIQLSGYGQLMTGGAYMPSSALYYMIPDESSVQRATNLINQMVDGQTINVSE